MVEFEITKISGKDGGANDFNLSPKNNSVYSLVRKGLELEWSITSRRSSVTTVSYLDGP